MNDDNYYVVQGWMRNKLGLTGNELIIYAIIYGFSQVEDQCYNGGLKYLCECSGASAKTVERTLNSLVERNLIIKEDIYFKGVKFCSYKTQSLYQSQNDGGIVKMTGVPSNCLKDTDKMTINNYINNKKENITNVIKEKESKCRFGNYNRILLTNTEYERLCSDFGKDVTDKQIELLDEYIESNNNKNKYTNFNLVIRKSLRENWFVKPDTTYTNNRKRIIRTNNPQWLKDYVENFEDGVEDL